MCRLIVVIKILSTLVIYQASAARILCVFPTPSFSHQIVYRSLTRALSERGHEVVVITTHPFPPGELPANVTEINVYDISHHIWQDGLSKVFHTTGDGMRIVKIYLSMFTNMFEKQIQSKPVQDLIKNGKTVDLLLLEAHVLSTLGLISVFNAPAIQTSTYGPILGTYSMFGASNHPLIYPSSVCHRLYNRSLWEEIQNLCKIAIYAYMMDNHEREDNEMLQRNLGSNIPPISKLYQRVNVYLQSVYPIWMNYPPVPKSIVYLGGLHQKPANNLSQDLQAILDSSVSEVIYVSFGSNVHPSLLCQEKIDMMARVFSKLPYKILWKRDENVQTEIARNIHISTWFPQSDLLYHPKIKLFITQGGLQSTEEAITAAVPLIGIPIFGDQWMHTENYVRLGIGLQLDWNILSEEELIRSIAIVIGNKSYKENVVRLRSIMNDQPQSAMDHALWWIEYVLKHGSTQHLFPASANMSWMEYYEVELIITVLVVLILVLSVLTLTILRLARCMFRRKTQKSYSKII